MMRRKDGERERRRRKCVVSGIWNWSFFSLRYSIWQRRIFLRSLSMCVCSLPRRLLINCTIELVVEMSRNKSDSDSFFFLHSLSENTPGVWSDGYVCYFIFIIIIIIIIICTFCPDDMMSAHREQTIVLKMTRREKSWCDLLSSFIWSSLSSIIIIID